MELTGAALTVEQDLLIGPAVQRKKIQTQDSSSIRPTLSNLYELPPLQFHIVAQPPRNV